MVTTLRSLEPAAESLNSFLKVVRTHAPLDLTVTPSEHHVTTTGIKAGFAASAGRELAVFFDEHDILGMEDWRQRILHGLRESHLLLTMVHAERH